MNRVSLEIIKQVCAGYWGANVLQGSLELCYFVFESDLKDSEMSKTKERFEWLILNSRTLDLVITAVVILSENCSLKLV
jgi:hypothetical protein